MNSGDLLQYTDYIQTHCECGAHSTLLMYSKVNNLLPVSAFKKRVQRILSGVHGPVAALHHECHEDLFTSCMTVYNAKCGNPMREGQNCGREVRGMHSTVLIGILNIHNFYKQLPS